MSDGIIKQAVQIGESIAEANHDIGKVTDAYKTDVNNHLSTHNTQHDSLQKLIKKSAQDLNDGNISKTQHQANLKKYEQLAKQINQNFDGNLQTSKTTHLMKGQNKTLQSVKQVAQTDH